MNKIIFANWKNNPKTKEEAIKLAQESDAEGLVICPPFIFLEEVAKTIKKSQLGAQDYKKDLKRVGVRHVIIGHSDQRRAGDTDDVIAQKFIAVINDDLIPILCVGETLEQKQSDKTFEVIKKQVETVFANLKFQTSNLKLFVAYEPVWAIGTGNVPDPQYVLEAIDFMQKTIPANVDVSFLYGGSIHADNANDFLQHNAISGLLVGGAGLDPKEIKRIVKIARE